MAMSIQPADYLSLSVPEKVALMGAIEASLVVDKGESYLTPAQQAELDRRMADLVAHPEKGMTWEELKESMRRRS